ncbi:ATP-dependent DNA ligase [Pseudoxanthomonas broegbernensis]|uniref:ATP-dependent DNA ligase n=1 Tax=Pseudoxanthomonas broegbernensis TaxID=83619 RepID=A0A7V8GQ99_9GAMM|nr:ATP-dependent DNA ligase [Pseudoxanthomonas broegbernensis]
MRLLEAARRADVAAVDACLVAGADPAAVDSNGFNPLHHAAMGANGAEPSTVVAVMRRLLDAGSPAEARSADSRTPLYLAAEFSSSPEPVLCLLDAGADPRVRDRHGNSIVVNAMDPDVRALLSAATGIVVEPPPAAPPSSRRGAWKWKATKARIEAVFEALRGAGMVALHEAGNTQEDGFADCAQAGAASGGLAPGIDGFCWYTRQDRARARRNGVLPLAFWGAPEGGEPDMRRVGRRIVDAFRAAGFTVDWDGSSATRPLLHL